jgi:hypothetical protein
VRIAATVWEDEVGRFVERSAARAAAERERGRLERDGLELSALAGCEAEGPDRTRLGGLVKAYVPLADRPASERPFGFIFAPDRGPSGPFLRLLAFGERHPAKGSRSVYERAHKRLHGRYPDQ